MKKRGMSSLGHVAKSLIREVLNYIFNKNRVIYYKDKEELSCLNELDEVLKRCHDTDIIIYCFE